MKVVEICRTCTACPSQWSGKLEDGRDLYIRFRWGSLGYGVGDSERHAVENCSYVKQMGDSFDGFLGDADMVRELADFGFDFSTVEWRSKHITI